ncbi:MAG: hypothetical protein FJ222_09275 [Lentisphaerae bacterium]|nr:hypothetical protein [Lentisphaerota bacterium]
MTITFEAVVVNVKRFTTKAGKEYSVFTLERQAVYKDVVTTEQYEVTAFGARANVAIIGDSIQATVRVGSRINKDRFWPSFTLIGAIHKGNVAATSPESYADPKPFSRRPHHALSATCS